MRLLFLFLTLVQFIFIFAQSKMIKERCGINKIYNQNPMLKYKRDYFHKKNMESIDKNYKRQKSVYYIPVVVHVIHNNGSENISKAQIESQITVLNEDFRRLNSDASNTPSSFQSVAADCEIEFFLAQKDPNGSCTDGINRVVSATYTDLDANSEDAALKQLIQWDPSMYLNIWIVKDIDGGGLSGYAYFPGVSNALDGLVISHESFGTLGTAVTPYDLGRTATHEIGHYFGLHHVWGQNNGGCTDDDGFSDTPIQNAENYSCPSHPSTSCTNSGDMFMNYMDYTDDNCMNLFTVEQKNFIQNHLNNTTNRASLHTSSNLIATGYSGCSSGNSPPIAEFSTSNTSINVGSAINFTDLSSNTPNDWTWTFSGGNPSTSNVQNPTGITYSTTGSYDVTLIAKNSYGSDTITKQSYINVSNSGTPVADFTASVANPIVNQSVSFNDLSTNAPTSWLWTISPATYNFTNSTNSASQNIDVIFTATGTYMVTLDATNSSGTGSQSKFYFVTEQNCDSLFHYDFPNYYIDNANTNGFLVLELDEDQNMPPNYLGSITVSDIPADYGIETPDLYFKFSNSTSLLYTSPVIESDPPVTWPFSIGLNNETYTVEVYDEDVLLDDYLGTVTFNGSNYSGSAYDYSNSKGTLQVDYSTTTFGITSSWMDFNETVNGVSNDYTGVTSEYITPGTADDWLIFGPVSIPSNGVYLKWQHKFGDDTKRNAYMVMINDFGIDPNNFIFGGDTLAIFSDNDPSTSGHTSWTGFTSTLDASKYGSKSVYIAFYHNSTDQDMLYLDDIKLSDCGVVVGEIDEKINNIDIYPNPFNEKLNIDLSSVNKSHNIYLYDNLGRLVHSLEEKSQEIITINTNQLSNGVYIIDIRNDESLYREKLILNK